MELLKDENSIVNFKCKVIFITMKSQISLKRRLGMQKALTMNLFRGNPNYKRTVPLHNSR